MGLFGGHSLAMDLGTANILVATPGGRIVINEPSVIALDTYTDRVLCVGREAKDFIGRAPSRISVVRPIRDGVIAHYEAARQMIAHFVRLASIELKVIKPRLVICVPMGITSVERRAVVEAGMQGGAREVCLISEPMAGAIGCGLPVQEPLGNMVLDIGGGTSEVAIITLSSVALSESVRVGGDAMNIAIQRYFQDRHQLLIGENMADELKIDIGAAVTLDSPLERLVYGKRLVDGSPCSHLATDADVREAIREPLSSIVTAVRKALEKTPPDLGADILEHGMLLVGGGSMLRGMDTLLQREAQIKVTVDENPLTAAVRGTAMTLDRKKGLDQVLMPD